MMTTITDDAPEVTDASVPESDSPEPVEVGQAAEGETSETELPEPSYFDVASHADHLVRVKVDGEELEVKLADAVSGYSRTADYTQKTQALAEERQRLAHAEQLYQALQQDPQRTLAVLQAQYQDVGQEPQVEEPPDDPIERRFWEQEQRLTEFETWQARQELARTVNDLSARYGDQFDPRAVVQSALQQGRDDLEGVFKEMAFEKYWEERNSHEASQKAENDQRNAAKEAAQVVSGGSNAAGASTAPVPSRPTSIADAFEMAVHEHGDPWA